jgi:solute carrier family 25 S-adenosylmethionine transporter 26
VGGIAASLIRVPTEVYIVNLCIHIYMPLLLKLNNPQVVKQRMQTGQFTSAPDAVRLIVSKEGFKGFYAVCYVSL